MAGWRIIVSLGVRSAWKWRSIAPILIVTACVFDLLAWPFAAYGSLVVAFAATLYFVSPDRLPKVRPVTDSELERGVARVQEELKNTQRILSETQLELAACKHRPGDYAALGH